MRFKKYEIYSMKVATIALLIFVISLLFCFAKGLHASFNASALIVAGGGGGGSAGGGGGAGGVTQLASITITGSTAIKIGLGGGSNVSLVQGTDGGPSSLGSTGVPGGGGGGGYSSNTGLSGGSGGGGTDGTGAGTGGAGTAGYGTQGSAAVVGSHFNSGGGGGASLSGTAGTGTYGGNGGLGFLSSISGSPVYYGNGGGGGHGLTTGPSSPASGFGGDGGTNTGGNYLGSGGPGQNPGDGGGGGAMGGGTTSGGSGANGIIIISAPISEGEGSCGSCSITTVGSNYDYTFTGNDTFIPPACVGSCTPTPTPTSTPTFSPPSPIHAYDFENSVYDSAGTLSLTAVGSGPSYVTDTPLPISGSYITGSYSDSNFLTVPGSIFSTISNSGSIEVGFFRPYQDAQTQEVIWLAVYPNGTYGQITANSTGAIHYKIPLSNATNVDVISATGLWSPGRPYDFILSYSGTSYWVYIYDIGCQSITLAGSGTAGASIAFANPSYVNVGSAYPLASGFYCGGYIDRLIFNNSPTGSPSSFLKIHPVILVDQFGASIFGGSNCSLMSDAYRTQLQNLSNSKGVAIYSVGQNSYGGGLSQGVYVQAPYSDCVGGSWTSEQPYQNISTNFPADCSTQIIMLGGDMVYNDSKNAGISAAQSQINIDSLADSIAAIHPIPKILFQTCFNPLNGGYPTQNQIIYNAYVYAKGKGYNAYYEDVSSCAGPEYNCGDGYHPTLPVYNAMGSCIFNEIESISSTGGNPFSRRFEDSFKFGVNNQP